MNNWIISVLCLVFVFSSVVSLFAADQRVVRVGAFNYYPGIFKDTDGAVKGFIVDALTDLGQRENIRFEYVYGSWSEGLERIKSGEVDVLTSVARTPERAQFLDYAATPLLTVWGELYAPQASDIDGIRGVQGKTIAVMKGDYNARHFIDLVKKFDITCEFVELPGFDDVFRAVSSKKVDAGVVNSTFGVAKQNEFGLRSTGVVFNPFDIFFAVAKNKNGDVLALLDSYMDRWRNQSDSPYNIARQKWSHGIIGTMSVIPTWLVYTSAALGILVFTATIFIVLLRRQVRRATEDILSREAHLRESTELVNLLLNSTAEAIYGLDLEGNCTLCNAATLRMLGYEKQEQLLGKNLHYLIHHTHADGTPFDIRDCSVFKSLQQGEGVYVDDEVLWKADGSCFLAEYWSHPLRRNGNLVGSVVTFMDISERKKIERDLLDKNRELERFTYTVSHDLKSPLITIQSYAGMIEQDMEEGNQARAQIDLKRIINAASKMTHLLDDLLRLSRVGRVMNSPAQVDMNRLVKNVMSQLAGLLELQQVEVVIQSELPTVRGDQRRIEEVLQNIVENAIKYKRDQARSSIEIGMREEQGKHVFFVQDNGIGIDERYHETVFGLFNKLDAKSEGTGIGLALVKRIVEVHGGRVWVESEGSGKGSTFCFTVGKNLA